MGRTVKGGLIQCSNPIKKADGRSQKLASTEVDLDRVIAFAGLQQPFDRGRDDPAGELPESLRFGLLVHQITHVLHSAPVYQTL